MTTTARINTPTTRLSRVGSAPSSTVRHPLAWWAWSLGVAVALTRTTNPLVVALVLLAIVVVVLARRASTPWARAFPAYLVLGAFVIVVRVGFYIFLGLPDGSAVLVNLPAIGLPDWVASVRLLGPVHVAGFLSAAYEGLRLAALIICFGAANAVTDPKRALRALPASLHHLGTAVVIAVTVTPQLAMAVRRVHRAQKLRGIAGRGPRAAVARIVPVLSDALEHALGLAASMDSRGYARSVPGSPDRVVGVTLVVALLSGALGTYGLLDASMPTWSAASLLAVGGTATFVASRVAGRRVHRTRYRPDQWGRADTAVAACGVLAAAAVVLGTVVDPAGMATGIAPLRAPALPLFGVLAAVCTVLPAAPRLLAAQRVGFNNSRNGDHR